MASAKLPTATHTPQLVPIVLDQIYNPPLRGLLVQDAGDVSVLTTEDQTIVIPSVLAGQEIKGGIQRVNTSGTTVPSPTTNIIGLR